MQIHEIKLSRKGGEELEVFGTFYKERGGEQSLSTSPRRPRNK